MLINAKEAKKRADEINFEKTKVARCFAENEWEAYIMPKIKEAMEKGCYSCTYYWTKSVFDEWNVEYLRFVDQFLVIGESLGYKIIADYEHFLCEITKVVVHITWGLYDDGK